MSDKYKYYDWCKHEVKEQKDTPKGAHYAVIVFDTRTEYTPPYDYHDRGEYSTSRVPEISYFCFYEREDLQAYIAYITDEKKKFFFFYVPKMGEHKINISVDVDIK